MESNRASIGFGLVLPEERWKPQPAKPGEDHPRATLTNADVREIFRLKGQVSQLVLAKRFSTHQSTISRIWSRRAWQSVTEGCDG